MAIRLKQSTASQEIPLGPFLDSTDGVTPETGLTIANTDIKLWAMGATSLANKNSGGATHMAGGIYYCTLDATDTATLGALVLFISVSGALPIKVECEVVSANVYDALVGGTDYLQVDVTDWKNATAPAMTGDAFARLGAPAGASVSADVAAVKAVLPAALVSGRIDASVGAMASGVLTAAAIASDAITAAKVASDAVAEIQSGLSTLNAADVRAAVGLASANLDTQLGDIQTDANVIREYGDNTVIRGTCASGASTTSLTPSALSPSGVDADQFKGRILVFDNDTATAALRGQATDITASSAASLAVLTFTALTTAPASGDTFSIV